MRSSYSGLVSILPSNSTRPDYFHFQTCTSFWRRLSMSSRACLDLRFSISRRSVRGWHTGNLSRGTNEKKSTDSRMCSVSMCYLLPVLVATLAPLCCWSAPASAQRSAAAETYTCVPSPPPNTQLGSYLTVLTMQLRSVCVLFSTGIDHSSYINSHCGEQKILLLCSWVGCWSLSGFGSLWGVCPLGVCCPTWRKHMRYMWFIWQRYRNKHKWCWCCLSTRHNVLLFSRISLLRLLTLSRL